jgi:sortase (surface protein transpeptidase)
VPIVPPVVQDPEKVIFVKPEEPKVIVLPELKEIPPQNIKVTEQPQYGTVTVNSDSTLTYVSNLTDPTSTAVDKFTITFTDLSGAVIVTGREIVLAQDGDVPSIIQTGFGLTNIPAPLNFLIGLIPLILIGNAMRGREKVTSVKALSGFIVAILALAFAIQPVSQPHAEAACKPVKPKGKTVGRVSVGDVDMSIKAFNYPAGGVMEPQATTVSAGLSKRHMPLSSQLGTSVITWHKDYNGCDNRLNTFFYKKVGDRFTITDENGDTQRFRVTKKLEVKKGDYKKSWFTLVGPRQLTLVTCTGRFKNGHYEDNLVVIATKIG